MEAVAVEKSMKVWTREMVELAGRRGEAAVRGCFLVDVTSCWARRDARVESKNLNIWETL